MKYKQIMNILSKDIQSVLRLDNLQFDYLQEIRLRVGRPVILLYMGKEKILPVKVTERGIRETLDYVSNYSLYAYENELKQGFITIEGGHRVGISGQVLVEQGEVKNFKNI